MLRTVTRASTRDIDQWFQYQAKMFKNLDGPEATSNEHKWDVLIRSEGDQHPGRDLLIESVVETWGISSGDLPRMTYPDFRRLATQTTCVDLSSASANPSATEIVDVAIRWIQSHENHPPSHFEHACSLLRRTFLHHGSFETAVGKQLAMQQATGFLVMLAFAITLMASVCVPFTVAGVMPLAESVILCGSAWLSCILVATIGSVLSRSKYGRAVRDPHGFGRRALIAAVEELLRT